MSLLLRVSNEGFQETMRCASTTGHQAPAGCSKRLSSKAAGESKPEAYPLGYVEDFDEPRTKLAGFFSILLETVHPPIVSTTRNRALPLSMRS
jgi:hypothetical protein